MEKFGLTIVIDAGSILSFIIWTSVILVVLYVLGKAFFGIVDFFNDISEINKKRKPDIQGTLSRSEVITYSLISVAFGFTVTILLIDQMPENLWYIAIAPFFISFYLASYFAKRIDKKRYKQ